MISGLDISSAVPSRSCEADYLGEAIAVLNFISESNFTFLVADFSFSGFYSSAFFTT